MQQLHDEYEFWVALEHDDDGRFVAICPALAGCYTEGETEAEARVDRRRDPAACGASSGRR